MAGKRGQSEAAALRRVESLQLRIAGASYRKIGTMLGVSEAQAFRDVQAELDKSAEQAQQEAGRLRTLEVRRLDEMLTRLSPLLYPERGSSVDLAAIDRALKIMERRAKLLGLDSPTQVSVDVHDRFREDYEAGRVTWEDVVGAYGESLAADWFARAGIAISEEQE